MYASNGEYEWVDDTRGGDMEMIVGGIINPVQLALSRLVLCLFGKKMAEQ